MKIIKKNKKAQISQMVMYYIPRIFFTIIALFVVLALIRGFIVTKVNTEQAETNVYDFVLMYSKNGISYYDEEIGRVYPGVIDINDLEKIEKEINKNLGFGERFGEKTNRMGARITYYSDMFEEEKKEKDEKKEETQGKKIEQKKGEREIYFNENFFNLLYGQKDLERGSYVVEREFDTVFKYNNDFYPGKIKIEVAVPNE